MDVYSSKYGNTVIGFDPSPLAWNHRFQTRKSHQTHPPQNSTQRLVWLGSLIGNSQKKNGFSSSFSIFFHHKILEHSKSQLLSHCFTIGSRHWLPWLPPKSPKISIASSPRNQLSERRPGREAAEVLGFHKHPCGSEALDPLDIQTLCELENHHAFF